MNLEDKDKRDVEGKRRLTASLCPFQAKTQPQLSKVDDECLEGSCGLVFCLLILQIKKKTSGGSQAAHSYVPSISIPNPRTPTNKKRGRRGFGLEMEETCVGS